MRSRRDGMSGDATDRSSARLDELGRVRAIDAFDAVLQESLTEFLSDPAHLMTASELAQFLAKFERYRSGKLDVIVAELRRADNRLS